MSYLSGIKSIFSIMIWTSIPKLRDPGEQSLYCVNGMTNFVALLDLNMRLQITPSFFKAICLDALTYPMDDDRSSFKCPTGTNYKVTSNTIDVSTTVFELSSGASNTINRCFTSNPNRNQLPTEWRTRFLRHKQHRRVQHSELQVKTAEGEVIGCKSACGAFGEPKYCCTSEFNNPKTCSPTAYLRLFKEQCSEAYSCPYDDKNSTFTCFGGPNYLIMFCP
ncbi:hypothetical protein UlMin_001934 [Ulmus minor]